MFDKVEMTKKEMKKILREFEEDIYAKVEFEK